MRSSHGVRGAPERKQICRCDLSDLDRHWMRFTPTSLSGPRRSTSMWRYDKKVLLFDVPEREIGMRRHRPDAQHLAHKKPPPFTPFPRPGTAGPAIKGRSERS